MIEKIFASQRNPEQREEAILYAAEHHIGYEVILRPTTNAALGKEDRNEEFAEKYQDIQGWLAIRSPSDSLNPISQDREIALASLHRYSETIDKAKELGAKYVIFRSTFHPASEIEGTYHDWIARSAEFWHGLITEQLRSTPIVLLMQNHMEQQPEILMDLISRVNSPRLKIALDVGMLNILSPKPAIDWIDFLGTHVEYIVASNNDGVKMTYDSLNQGELDMESFINHIALLPQRLHLSLHVRNMKALDTSYKMLQPFLQAQLENVQRKNMII